jgi:hypothetical protein
VKSQAEIIGAVVAEALGQAPSGGGMGGMMSGGMGGFYGGIASAAGGIFDTGGQALQDYQKDEEKRQADLKSAQAAMADQMRAASAQKWADKRAAQTVSADAAAKQAAASKRLADVQGRTQQFYATNPDYDPAVKATKKKRTKMLIGAALVGGLGFLAWRKWGK